LVCSYPVFPIHLLFNQNILFIYLSALWHRIDPADRYSLLIIAIEFSKTYWPGLENYNDGRALAFPNQTESWSYAILPRLARLLLDEGITTRRLFVFGHSAGGQFVHRLMSSQPHDLFEAATTANSGWYTLPTLMMQFPEGFAGVGLQRAHLIALLAYPLLILIGECDNDPNDPYLPGSAQFPNVAASRQGTHRLARAQFYFEAGQAAAAALRVACNWQLRTVPGVAHDGRAMSAASASIWFNNGQMLSTAEITTVVNFDENQQPRCEMNHTHLRILIDTYL
jgi:hypothetical protein